MVNFTASDDDGDSVAFVEAKWFLNDALQTNVGNEDRLPAHHMTRGDTWHAVLVLSDGTDTSETASNAVVIGNAPPIVSVAWPENATSLIDLTPVLSVDDVDEDPEVSYQGSSRETASSTAVPGFEHSLKNLPVFWESSSSKSSFVITSAPSAGALGSRSE